MSQPTALSPLSIIEIVAECLALEQSGEVASALRRARQALDAARTRGEPSAVAEMLVCVARLRFRLGQYRAASALAEEVLALAAPDAPVRADAWQILGNCAAETGSLTDAETFYRRAVDLGREIAHHRAHVAALHGLAAAVHIPRGKFDLALAADEEACRIARKLRQQEWLPYPLIAIAMAHQLTGQGQQARAALAELNSIVPSGT